MKLLHADISTAEFLAVDVETNGRGSEACELTEVGTVVVGGGETHDGWESLVRVEYPLSRGIQRFTGISQAMVDSAPEPQMVLERLAEMLDGRVLVAHSASFDRRVLRQAFERCGIPWPDPPTLCTVAMARRFAPLARERKLAPLAESLGIEVDVVHRALADAQTCAKVFCALFPKLCANARTVAEARALLGPRRGAPRKEQRVRRRPPGERPDLSKLPQDPGVYVFRDSHGRPLYVGKSVSLRSRARSHFCAPAGWTERAEIVDYKPTISELGALVLENRLIKEWRPPGNKALKRSDSYVYLRCRLDISFPVLEVAPEPAPGHAVNVGPLRPRAAAQELADQLNSLFQLRHCGRKLVLREHRSLYGQMGRCLSPCLGDLDPNLYRTRLDEAMALFQGPGDAAISLLRRLEEHMHEASEAQHFERAAVLRDRHARLSSLLERLGGVLRATHASSQLVLARHPAKDSFDAFWIVAGRVRRWGPLPAAGELVECTSEVLSATALRHPAPVPREEVDEVRIVSSWIAANEPPRLELSPELEAERLVDWVQVAAS